jgi:hypothetical protein
MNKNLITCSESLIRSKVQQERSLQMTNILRQHFPMLREREDILGEIDADKKLSETFYQWTKKQQEDFLDICTGVRGVKILYDAFFKEIMNPEYAPERLNEVLSLLLAKKVKICKVLPTDSTRIADESSLLIMDILVELEDKSLANVEVQKIGYHFPGQRSACYSADLLLRQYKRVREEKEDQNRKFSYRDIKTVYTIVFFEKSTSEFKEFPDDYIHHFEQQSNTGIEIDLLQKYIFIPLDVFRERKHNKTIKNDLEAWLTFFSTDSPEEILHLIECYPRFVAMYEEVFSLCANTERVIEMWSEELLELDRNTVQYMVDEMQDEITKQKKEISRKDDEIELQRGELNRQKESLDEKDNIIKELQAKLAELQG